MENLPISKGRREGSRLRLGVPARLELLGRNEKCELVDISKSGARLLLDAPPRPGVRAVVSLDGFEAFGVVVWSNHCMCGLRFEDEVRDTELFALRQRTGAILQRENEKRVEFARRWATGTV